jgi:subtilisin family serine protease
MTFGKSTRRARFWSALLFIFGLVFLSVGSALAQSGVVRGYIFVRVTAGTDINALAASYGSVVLEHLPEIDAYRLQTPNGADEEEFALSVAANTTQVVYAEPDHYFATPEVQGSPFHMAFDRSWRPQTYANSASYVQMNAGGLGTPSRSGPRRPLSTGRGVTVAVLDTGAAFDHPGIRKNLLDGYDVLSPGKLPMDVADGANNSAFGHGTMIAGILVRLAPQVQILPVRVIDGDGVGTILGLIKGIIYAQSQGVNIMNISLSSIDNSSPLHDAMEAADHAGIVLVTAAGNHNSRDAFPPADGPGALSVGSVEADNRKSPYSNYHFVRVVAPGSNVRSTYPGGGYATWSGTSFAAPFVAAQAALIWSVRPEMTSEAIKDLIRDTARSVRNVNPNHDLGDGLVNIEASLRAALRR